MIELNMIYNGKVNYDEVEKEVRRELGLPIKKDLVYYLDKSDSNSKVGVRTYIATEQYEISSTWYMLDITTDDNNVVSIHSAYFAEMQKPTFVADMVAQSSKM